jgi:hypothetical protein
MHPGYKIYSSPNPKQDPSFTKDDVWKISLREAFTLDVDLRGGIHSTGNFGIYGWNGRGWQSKIHLTIYAYDDTKVNGKGMLIYECKASQAALNDTFIEEMTTVYPEPFNVDILALREFNVKSKASSSLDIKRLGMNAKYQAPDNLPASCTDPAQTSEIVAETIEDTGNKESWFTSVWRWFTHQNGKIRAHNDGMGERSNVLISQDCNDWIDEHVLKNKVIVEVTLEYPVFSDATTPQIDFTRVKIPLLGIKNKSDFTSEAFPLGAHLSKVLQPDYDKMVVAAHRGYFKDVPENSSAAITKAIEQGVEIVEIDIRLTKDKQIILAHDFQLGRLTNIPDRIREKSPEEGWPEMPGPPSGKDKILVSNLTLAEIRPDLFGHYGLEPIYLKKADGTLTNELIPTLKEVLQQCKNKVIVDIDKIENFFDLVYQDAKETGTLHQIIVKGRFGNPQALKDNCCSSGVNNLDKNGNEIIDWSQYMFTPIYFADASPKDENGADLTILESLDSFITASSSTINCVGVEWVYFTDDDPLIPLIPRIKSQNKHIIQFPQYPENSGGVWNPKKLRFTDIDLRKDFRNDWEWLLDPSRRPSMVITDRLEVLLRLLEIKGLREARN